MRSVLTVFSVFMIVMTIVKAEENEEHEEQKETIPGAGLSVLFIFGGLLYSGILKAMCDKVNVMIFLKLDSY